MSEKEIQVDTGSLPVPSTTPERRRGLLAKHVGFGLIAFGLLWHFVLSPVSTSGVTYTTTDGYLAGVVEKGLRLSTGYKDAKDDKKACKMANGGWITPKAAEEIYLTVPNNDSARA